MCDLIWQVTLRSSEVVSYLTKRADHCCFIAIVCIQHQSRVIHHCRVSTYITVYFSYRLLFALLHYILLHASEIIYRLRGLQTAYTLHAKNQLSLKDVLHVVYTILNVRRRYFSPVETRSIICYCYFFVLVEPLVNTSS